MAESVTEGLITRPDACAIATATPLQRAICRAADGVPLGELEDCTAVREAFGGREALRALRRLDGPPRELTLVAGIRTFKTTLAAALAIKATQTVDVSMVGPGEVVRLPVLATKTSMAQAAFRRIRGVIMQSPRLRQLVVEEKEIALGGRNADTLVVRHPSGVEVEIVVTALGRAGDTLGSFWLASVIFDEAPRMSGEEARHNYVESRDNAEGRILPGGMIINIGSPWRPAGPIYDQVQERHGKPDRDLVVVRATGPQLNPHHWTPERVERTRRTRPVAYRQNCLAEFVETADDLITSRDLDLCTRADEPVIHPEPGHRYFAALDSASGGSNSWTLVIVNPERRENLPFVSVCFHRQWAGKTDPQQVLSEMASICQKYSIRRVDADAAAKSQMIALARSVGLQLVTHSLSAPQKVEMYESLAEMISLHALSLPNGPQIRSDVLGIRRSLTPTGQSTIALDSSAGRHSDFAWPLAKAVQTAVRPGAHGDPPPRARGQTIAAQLRPHEQGPSDLEVGPDGRLYRRRRRSRSATMGGGF